MIDDTSVDNVYLDTTPFEFTDTSSFDLSTLEFVKTNFDKIQKLIV